MEYTMTKMIVLFVIGTTILTEVACKGVQVKNLEILQNSPNDYFGNIETDVKPDGEISLITVKAPILKDIDETFQLKVNLQFNKIPILKDQVFHICDVIAKDGFFKPVLDKMEPAGKFPPACPIPAGDWTIKDFKIDMKDFLPFGIAPSGDFDLQFEIGLPNAEAMLKVIVSGSVTSSTGLPSLSKIF